MHNAFETVCNWNCIQRQSTLIRNHLRCIIEKYFQLMRSNKLSPNYFHITITHYFSAHSSTIDIISFAFQEIKRFEFHITSSASVYIIRKLVSHFENNIIVVCSFLNYISINTCKNNIHPSKMYVSMISLSFQNIFFAMMKQNFSFKMFQTAI